VIVLTICSALKATAKKKTEMCYLRKSCALKAITPQQAQRFIDEIMPTCQLSTHPLSCPTAGYPRKLPGTRWGRFCRLRKQDHTFCRRRMPLNMHLVLRASHLHTPPCIDCQKLCHWHTQAATLLCRVHKALTLTAGTHHPQFSSHLHMSPCIDCHM